MVSKETFLRAQKLKDCADSVGVPIGNIMTEPESDFIALFYFSDPYLLTLYVTPDGYICEYCNMDDESTTFSCVKNIRNMLLFIKKKGYEPVLELNERD